MNPLKMRRLLKSNKGVTLIFFVLCLGIMLGFLCLVLNTGILVYQKIRLQSSVDLAAYAAAAVQASYLGNESDSQKGINGSGETSIRSINAKIFERYAQLIEDMKFGSIAPAPGFGMPPVPEPATCVILCQAANLANGKHAAHLYKEAAADMEVYRMQISKILHELPTAARRAAEETMSINIPDLAIKDNGNGRLTIDASVLGNTTNLVDKVMEANDAEFSNADFDPDSKPLKNAVLTFQSMKGMYLANVVAAVPHTFAYFGPMCFNLFKDRASLPMYYCSVNGTGAPGGMPGYGSAVLAYGRSKLKDGTSGNIGRLSPLFDKDSNAIRLMFIPNYHKPDPFALVAAEWYPENGSYANLENSLGAKGSLFPKRTRLVAIAEAEPFGGSLLETGEGARGFGVRLAAIRKALLDPRMQPVKEDYPGMFKYLQSFGARNDDGEMLEQPEEVVRKFLH